MIKCFCLAVLALGLSFMLTACDVRVKPVSQSQRSARIKHDWQVMFSHQARVNKPITLYSAIARALKYNLDIRLKTLEAVLSKNQYHLSSYELLPDLAASAGYLTRSNVNAAGSFQIATDTFNFGPSTSQDVNRNVADLQASWDVLDFGINYMTARQRGDQYFIALQRRRKMIQNVVRDVRYSYWRAVSAIRLQRQLRPLLKQVTEALRQSRHIQKSSLKPVLEELRYRRSLLEVLRLIRTLQRNIVQAKAELRALMSLPPDVKLNLVIPRRRRVPLPKGFPLKRHILESVALYDRPELREEDYRKQIALDDVTKARLRMLPTLGFDGGLNHDSNSFLLFNRWANGGFLLTWNLLNFISGPAAIKTAKDNKAIANMRRMALSMAIITQVDVAYYRYLQIINELSVGRRLRRVNNQIYDQLLKEYQAKKVDQLVVIRANARRILSDLRYDIDYAEWQNAGGQIVTSIGYDEVPLIDSHASLASITHTVRIALNTAPKVKRMFRRARHHHHPYQYPLVHKPYYRFPPKGRDGVDLEYVLAHQIVIPQPAAEDSPRRSTRIAKNTAPKMSRVARLAPYRGRSFYALRGRGSAGLNRILAYHTVIPEPSAVFGHAHKHVPQSFHHYVLSTHTRLHEIIHQSIDHAFYLSPRRALPHRGHHHV